MNRLSLALGLLVLLSACGGESDTEAVAKARTQLAQGDLPGAVIHLKNALGKNPGSAEARLLLGRTLLNSGDAAGALIELRKAQDAKAGEDQVVPDIARALLATGEGAKLIGEFGDKTLVQRSRHGRTEDACWPPRTPRRVRMQNAREAIAQALQAVPGHAPAVVLNARLDASAGQLDAALASSTRCWPATPATKGRAC
jgi:tetratricopeptide (TPR) repeat protein